jgi:hypothetical protein
MEAVEKTITSAPAGNLTPFSRWSSSYPSHYTERTILLFVTDLRLESYLSRCLRILYAEPYHHSAIRIHGVVLKKYY